MTTTNDTLPMIFLLDLDQTIIGNVQYQVSKYSLQEKLRDTGLKKVARNNAPPDAYKLDSKLIRPYFINFINAIKRRYPWCIICVFTASERKWAHLELSWLAQTIHFKPDAVFTREDCHIETTGSYRKSVSRILPRIWRITNKTRILNKNEKEKVLKERLLIIDDNAVWSDYQDHLLLCPSYDYLHFENLADGLTKEEITHPRIQQELLTFANEGVLCPHILTNSNGGDPNKLIADPLIPLAKQLSWMSKRCRSIIIYNRTYVKDRFWRMLIATIDKNHLNKFTPSIISQLQKVIWNKPQ